MCGTAAPGCAMAGVAPRSTAGGGCATRSAASASTTAGLRAPDIRAWDFCPATLRMSLVANGTPTYCTYNAANELVHEVAAGGETAPHPTVRVDEMDEVDIVDGGLRASCPRSPCCPFRPFSSPRSGRWRPVAQSDQRELWEAARPPRKAPERRRHSSRRGAREVRLCGAWHRMGL